MAHDRVLLHPWAADFWAERGWIEYEKFKGSCWLLFHFEKGVV